MSTTIPRPFLTIRECAAILGCCQGHVYNMCKSGALPYLDVSTGRGNTGQPRRIAYRIHVNDLSLLAATYTNSRAKALPAPQAEPDIESDSE